MKYRWHHKYRLKLGKEGRVALPRQIKDVLNISPGDHLEMYIEDNAIILKARKAEQNFIFSEELEALAR